MSILDKYKHLTTERLIHKLAEIKLQKAERLQVQQYVHLSHLRDLEKEIQQVLLLRSSAAAHDHSASEELH